MRHLGREPSLDAIRGIAILLVLLAHTHQLLPGGRLGVDLFFVLSGFLITSLLLSEWDSTGSIAFGGFYARRALRLLPALFVAMGVLALVAQLTSENAGQALTWIGLTLGYVINVAALHEHGIPVNSLQHMWSLAQEEQFYVVWPVLLFVGLRVGVKARTIAVVLGALGLLVICYRAYLLAVGAPLGYAWYAPHLRSDGLIIGCLAGVVFSYGVLQRLPRGLSAMALVPAVSIPFLIDPGNRLHLAVLLPAFVIAWAVLILAAIQRGSWFARLVTRRPLCGLGRISYGLYIWHWPVFILVGWELGIPLAILVAWLSYRYVERPFLSLKDSMRSETRAKRSSTLPPAPEPAGA
jgi:peptidoglycan/LPS O-acetylase OafA/YrhL